MVTNPEDPAVTGANRTLLGHPPGVGVLVALKAWELFSYQGMRAFLVFYLIGTFALSDAQASVIFGSYAALVLALAVLGGVVADRWLGRHEPMVLGASIIMSGHLCLALETVLAGLGALNQSAQFQVFCLGLSLIAVGTGLLKPNVLNLLGALYRRDDPLRERGFYAYYIGVNIGAFAAPIVCGYLGTHYGWGWGFAAAAIGMALGLTTLLLGRRWVQPVDTIVHAGKRRSRLVIYPGILVTVGVTSFLIQHGVALGILLLACLLLSAIYFAAQSRRDDGVRDPALLLRLLALMAAPFTFSILFEQFSLSINLFNDRIIDRSFMGHEIAAPQLLSLNAFFVLLFLPLLGAAWSALGRRGREPATSSKFALGFASIATGFLLLATATGLVDPGTRIPIAFVVVAYFLITMGELCISPLAYATVGQIVPASLQGIAMGMLLLAFALGNLGASWLATAAAIPVGTSDVGMRALYAEFFMIPTVAALVAAGLCLAARHWLNPPSAR